MFLTCFGEGSAQNCKNHWAQKKGTRLCAGSFGDGKSDEMVQSESLSDGNERDNYDKLKLFQSS